MVQQRTRLEFAKIGPVWRNNVGVMTDDRGIPVRYGLANETAAMNKEIKSSDLICITPVTAYLQSLASWVRLGVFTALEVKPSGWVQKPSDERAIAQAKFHAIVREAGGFAGFVSNEKDIQSIIRQL